MTRYLTDGFKTLLTLQNVPSIKLLEKSVTPSGPDGGGAIPISTMRNTRVRTKAPKALLDFSDISGTYAYDPAVLTDLIAQAQVNQQITVTYPDASHVVYWGWLDKAVPDAHVEGAQPTIKLTFIISNTDNNGTEVLPAYGA